MAKLICGLNARRSSHLSSDKTIRKGDFIWLSENDDLNCVQGSGWLTKDEWDQPGTNDFECEESAEYYLDIIGKREIVKRR